MQPLSRVNPDATAEWGLVDVMRLRPELAVKVAHCTAKWSEVEIFLGAFLAFLLHANEKAAFAMYAGLENRSAQLRLITSAAEATLPSDHFDVVSVLISAVVRPAMRERDKLAHWSWGYSKDLPNGLLIAEPSSTLEGLLDALRAQPSGKAEVPSDFSGIYVVRDRDLDGIAKRFETAKEYLRLAMASVWAKNAPERRAEFLRQLTNEPRIREGLTRLREGRQKNQEAQPPSPQSGRSD